MNDYDHERGARPPAGTEPQQDLLVLLHDVARLSRIEADKRARQHDLTRAQWVMLLKLARHPGLSQKDLAEILEVEPMTVARLTDRLERRGLVERRADPRDRRIWRLHLTEEAAPMLGIVKAQRAEVADLVMKDLDPQMIETMMEGLSRMKAALLAAHRGLVRPAPVMDEDANSEQEMV